MPSRKELTEMEKTVEVDNQDAGKQQIMDSLRVLGEETGMSITQENGQRCFGPPVNWEGPPPPKGCEVFVGKLPRDVYEPDLVPLFSKIGRIYEMRLMMDFSGTNRGYCFVQYTNREDAQKAIHDLNNYEIRKGRKIGVLKSVDNCRLFIGGLPKHKTENEIFEEINRVTEGVKKVIAYPSAQDKTKNRGFAFVEYNCHKTAAMARRKMIPGKILMWGQDVCVDWAEPEPEVDPAIMNKALLHAPVACSFFFSMLIIYFINGFFKCFYRKTSNVKPDLKIEVQNLYVRNLMLSTTEETLNLLFNKHSDEGVEKVKKIKDYAFIHFSSREKANAARIALDKTEIDGSQIEINWAKPVEKGSNVKSRCPKQRSRDLGSATSTSSPEARSRLLSREQSGYNHSNAHLVQFGGFPSAVMVPSPELSQPYMMCNYIPNVVPFSGFSPKHQSASSGPIQDLAQICGAYGYGEPIYFPMSVLDANTVYHDCLIQLSHHPAVFRAVRHDQFFASAEDAKFAAAEGMIRMLQGDMTFLPASVSMPFVMHTMSPTPYAN